MRRHLLHPQLYKDYVQRLDLHRLQRAQQFLNELDPITVRTTLSAISGGQETDSVDVAIVMVTAARDPGTYQSHAPEYVTETVSKLLSHFTDPYIMADFPYSVKLVICNGGTNPHHNEPAIRLHKYVEVVTMPSKEEPKNKEDKYVHESVDYMLCLNESLKYSPRYILALEDDAYAREDMWELLKFAISKKFDRPMSLTNTVTSIDNVAYIKLMRPEYRLGYLKTDFQAEMEIFSVSVLFGTLLTVLQLAVKRILFPRQRGSSTSIHITWLAWCIYIILVVLVIGRPCVLEIRRLFPPHLYSFVPAQSGCIPAVLFPRHSVPSLVSYLNNTRDKHSYGKDILMDHWTKQNELAAYQVFPSAFIHIGHVSTKLNRDAFHVF